MSAVRINWMFWISGLLIGIGGGRLFGTAFIACAVLAFVLIFLSAFLDLRRRTST